MNQTRKRKSPERPQLSQTAPQNPKIRLDLDKRNHCLVLLKKIMSHTFGWVFNHPVDPVKLEIPDYFDIISHPMDLGTVHEKLKERKYFLTSQFCKDVRLTFSNAMRYNPPGNEVYTVAKQLNEFFNKGWKSLEEKWVRENPNPNLAKGNPNLGRAEEKRRRESPNLVNRNPNSNLDRMDERKRKENPNVQRENPSFERENPSLNKRAKVAVKGPVERAKPSEIVRKNGQSSVRASYKAESSNGHSIGARTEKSNKNANGHTFSAARAEKSNYYSNSAERSNGIPQTSASCEKDVHVSTRIRIPLNGKRTQSSKSGSSDSQPSTAPKLSEVKDESALIEPPMSPRKALRAAMLKKRYAGTILKAEQKILLDQGTKMDPAKLELERQKLERRQLEVEERIRREERALIEAAQKAAHEKRQQERAAARLEIAKMVKTVDCDNTQLIKDVENLWESAHEFPMESIGLFRKSDEYYGSSDEEREEGEIF